MNQTAPAVQARIPPQANDLQIVWLSGESSTKKIGSKAAKLATLLSANFSVPPGFCITEPAYRRHVLSPSVGHDLPGLLAKNEFSKIRERLMHMELDPSLTAEVLSNFRYLGEATSVAVRSSSTAEDLEECSFAGLYETLLDITGEKALLEAIRQCWVSYWSDEAVLYRQAAGVGHIDHGMAVLVQRMVQAQLAGVLFTQDPLSPEMNVVVIEATTGNGGSLVSGDTRGVRYRIGRESRQLIRSSPTRGQLDSGSLNRLVSLGLAIEKRLGVPQDIEWCLDQAGRLWVLQARPITTSRRIPTEFSSADLGSGWRRAYDEPFSTFGCDLAERRHSYWVRAVNQFYKTSFRSEIKSIEGFLYYKSSWETARSCTHLWMRFWRLLRWWQGLHTRDQYIAQLPAHIQRLSAIDRQPVSSLDATALLKELNAAIKIYLEFQLTSHAIGVVGSNAAALLNRFCRLCLSRSSFTALDFVSGLETLSVRRDMDIHRLGERLRLALTASEVTTLEFPGLSVLKERNAAGKQFCEELEGFQEVYGYVWADRYPRDPAWELNQEALMATLVQAAQAESGTGLGNGYSRQQQRRLEAIQRVNQEILGPDLFPVRRWLFSWLLRRAEQLFPYKEDRNHYVYQAVMVVRKYAREIGLRLKARQLLRSESDVFFLTWDELQKIVCDESSATALQQQIEQRRSVYRHSRQQTLQRKTCAPTDSTSPEGFRLEMVGEACSPGVATGSVRLISGLGELQRVQPGEIMVCGQLRPAWTSVFGRAGGIVVEMGSLLSHGSTLAREYGIPAVINIAGLTEVVREGDRLTVDGHLGRIVLERSPLQGCHGGAIVNQTKQKRSEVLP